MLGAIWKKMVQLKTRWFVCWLAYTSIFKDSDCCCVILKSCDHCLGNSSFRTDYSQACWEYQKCLMVLKLQRNFNSSQGYGGILSYLVIQDGSLKGKKSAGIDICSRLMMLKWKTEVATSIQWFFLNGMTRDYRDSNTLSERQVDTGALVPHPDRG